jgi:succinoglycan biosynthesis transport protein ExoP
MTETTALRRYLGILRRRLAVAMITAAGVLAVVIVYVARQPPVYQATAQALINLQQMDLANSLAGQPSNFAESTDNGRFAFTQVGIAQSPIVAANTAKALGLHTTAHALLSHILVTGSANTDLLTFAATSSTGTQAKALVNRYVHEYVAYVEKLDTAAINQAQNAVATLLAQARASHRSASLSSDLVNRSQQLTIMRALQTGDVQTVAPAVTASKIKPKPVEYIVGGAVLAIVLGIGMAFLFDALDTRVRDAEEVIALTELPLLARVPRFARVRGRTAIVHPTLATGQAEEAFRMLRIALELADVDRRLSCLLVTSSVPSEGKSTVSTNLAVSIAKSGKTVGLVDLDLRKPAIAGQLGLDPSVGITAVAARHVSLAAAMVEMHIVDGVLTSDRVRGDRQFGGRLLVLPSGPLPPDPGDFIQSAAIEAIIAECRRRVDILIIDGPPLLAVGDPMSLSRLADGVLLVARPELLRRHALREARRLIDALPAKVVGVVANGLPEAAGYGYYGRSYRSSTTTEPTAV